jgi:hypothetical protein
MIARNTHSDHTLPGLRGAAPGLERAGIDPVVDR